MTDLPEYVARNQANWNEAAPDWVAAGERSWAGEPRWGIWEIPELQLGLLPNDMTGMDAIELGCGTGYVAAWMARRGARVVGIDVSENQLATARRLAEEHGEDIEWILGNAESVPYPDDSFDFAISEYGAAIWADPLKWIPESHRLLRSGGQLVFLGNHPFVHLTQPLDEDVPAGRALLNPYFGMHRIDWDEGEVQGTEFNLPFSDWMRLFSDTGFEVISYQEIQAPQRGEEVRFFVSADWAHDYPSEQVWKVRKL